MAAPSIHSHPGDGETRVGLLNAARQGTFITGDQCGRLIGRVQQPSIARFGGKQYQVAKNDDPCVVLRPQYQHCIYERVICPDRLSTKGSILCRDPSAELLAVELCAREYHLGYTFCRCMFFQVWFLRSCDDLIRACGL